MSDGGMLWALWWVVLFIAAAFMYGSGSVRDDASGARRRFIAVGVAVLCLLGLLDALGWRWG